MVVVNPLAIDALLFFVLSEQEKGNRDASQAIYEWDKQRGLGPVPLIVYVNSKLRQ